MHIRTVQLWRAELERQGLMVTQQRPGRSSEYLVIRDATQRDWAKQQNQAVLGTKRRKFKEFGSKGASAKASRREANLASGADESHFPPTGANPVSAITESKQSPVGNIEADGDPEDGAAEELCSASKTRFESQISSTDHQEDTPNQRERQCAPASFRGFDLARWAKWLGKGPPDQSAVAWLMSQVDRIQADLGVSDRDAQWLLERCMFEAKRRESPTQLPKIIADLIKRQKSRRD